MIGAALLLVLLLPPVASAEDRCAVSVRVTNGHARTIGVAIGPVDLMVEARVPPRNQNRYLVLAWDYATQTAFDLLAGTDGGLRADAYDGAIGSAEMSLDGAEERTLHQRKMQGLSGGTYEVRATVYRDTKKQEMCGVATTRVLVW